MNNDRIYYSHDAEMHAMRDRGLVIALCLTFGLVIGTAVALLFAPATGKNTRKDLAKNVDEGLKDGREIIDPIVKQLDKEFKDFRKDIEERLKH